MDNIEINQRLRILEEQTYDCLKFVSQYSFDHTIEEDDYSKEYLYFELFHSLSNYGRAIKAVDFSNKLNSRLKTVYSLSLETLALEETGCFERLNKFGKQYFSSKRYSDQINVFKENIKFDSLSEIPEDSRIILEDELFAIFKIRDEINQLNRGQSLFVDYVKSLDYIGSSVLESYKQAEKEISVEHDKNRWLWCAFCNVIEDHRSALLIPNDEAVSNWWYKIEQISIESIEAAINNNFSYQKDKATVMDALSKAMSGQLDKIKDNLNDTVGWIVDNHNEAFNHLLNLSKSPTPAFQTWSSETINPTKSDHAVSGALFRTIPGINQEIIRDLIKVVQFDEEINDEKRNEVLATAYLIIGEVETALKLLNDKQK